MAERVSIDLQLACADTALVLRLVSVLHRRAVDVRALDYAADGAEGATRLRVDLVTTAASATTVARTLANVVGVLDVKLLGRPINPDLAEHMDGLISI